MISTCLLNVSVELIVNETFSLTVYEIYDTSKDYIKIKTNLILKHMLVSSGHTGYLTSDSIWTLKLNTWEHDYYNQRGRFNCHPCLLGTVQTYSYSEVWIKNNK